MLVRLLVVLWLCMGCFANEDTVPNINKSSKPSAEANKRGVFIVTLPRSGSTFVGELFRQSNEFAYLFEATRVLEEAHVTDGCAAVPSPVEANIMESLFNCNFLPLKEHVDQMAVNRSYIYSWKFITDHSSHWTMVDKCLWATENTDHQSVAIKEIGFWAPKLKWLHSVLGNKLRIVWLMRDIRGWVSSWLILPNRSTRSFYDEWGMHDTDLWERYDRCSGSTVLKDYLSQAQLENLKYLMQNLSEPAHKRMAAWWTVENAFMLYYLSQLPKEISMLVSYEHVSGYPVEVTQELYQFLGKEYVPKDTMQWIFDNTVGGGDDKRYGTARDSSKMASVWRERLSEQQLREVEEIGAPLFKVFNYTFYAQ